jgi:hypothetical protein
MRPLIANPSINRAYCQADRNTFNMKPVRQLLTRWVSGAAVIVDPFARESKWGTITNDINPAMTTDYHMDAAEFAELLLSDGIKADAVLFDPPYSLEQAKRSYETAGKHFSKQDAWRVNRWNETKNALAEIVIPRGIVISFGWSSSGFGKRRQMYLEEILMVNHGAGHHDTIIVVERKTY